MLKVWGSELVLLFFLRMTFTQIFTRGRRYLVPHDELS